MKPINKNGEMFFKNISPQKTKAFTLVELIIVITILAILATIAFISFQNYTKNSRDGNRLATITQIQKWLELSVLKTAKYPNPDEVYGTGIYEPTTTNLNYVWYIWENIRRLINMNKIPLDPVTENKYVYGVSANHQKYQLATTLENPLIPTTYANGTQARVTGNYIYPLRLWGYLYSLPSLIFVGSGITSTGFIIDKGSNLPYKLNTQTPENTQTISQQLQQLTGTSATLIFTGVQIPTLTSEEFKNLTEIPESLLALWISNKDLLGTAIFWNSYFSEKSVWSSSSSSSGGWETPPPTCTSWTLTPTQDCQPDWTQTVSASNPEPNWCTWWTPPATQSCTYVPPIPNAYNQTRHTCETETVTVWTYQIASCNVWATAIWTWETSYWHYFQWWNQYGFANNSSALTPTPTSERQDTSSCAPNNCRFDTFITNGTSPWDWANPQNNNLWGWDCSNTATPSEECKLKSRWPCPEWFHVPTNQQWVSVINTLSVWSNWNTLRDSILKLPMSGLRNNSTGSPNNRVSFGYYWSSTPFSTSAHYLYFNSSNVSPSLSNYRALGFSVRCFKN